MALSKDWREFLELLNSRGVARSPRFCAVQDDRTCLYRAIAFRCRILLLGLGFFAEPTSPFRFGLLCRCRRCNRFFLLLRWLLDSWLFAVGFFFLWLWFGFLLFRLLLVSHNAVNVVLDPTFIVRPQMRSGQRRRRSLGHPPSLDRISCPGLNQAVAVCL